MQVSCRSASVVLLLLVACTHAEQLKDHGVSAATATQAPTAAATGKTLLQYEEDMHADRLDRPEASAESAARHYSADDRGEGAAGRADMHPRQHTDHWEEEPAVRQHREEEAEEAATRDTSGARGDLAAEWQTNGREHELPSGRQHSDEEAGEVPSWEAPHEGSREVPREWHTDDRQPSERPSAHPVALEDEMHELDEMPETTEEAAMPQQAAQHQHQQRSGSPHGAHNEADEHSMAEETLAAEPGEHEHHELVAKAAREDDSLVEPPFAAVQRDEGAPEKVEAAAETAAVHDLQSHEDNGGEVVARLPEHPGTWAPVPQPGGSRASRQDDVDTTGACRKWVERYCEEVEAGEGAVADCLSHYQAAADSGETDSRHRKLEPLSDDCHEEVMQFRIKRSKSVEDNPALSKACAEDIGKFCNVTWFEGLKSGSVLACLRDAKPVLAPACQAAVFKLQLDGALDYRADASLQQACHSDAEALCANVKHGGGRVQHCLRSKRTQLSPECEAELFRQEVEGADDIRLSVRLFRACLPDKKQFCADVPPGKAMAKQCLEDHRQSLSDACRSEVDAMIERRVRDFRLDTKLKAACEGSIVELCSYMEDVTVLDTDDSGVIKCLQDFREDIKSEACRAQVHKYVELAAQDIRFNVPLADACFNDRQELCANVPPGSARVIRCLQNQRDKLSSVCKATLLNEEVRFSENIDFQYPLKQACATEVERYCDAVPHGAGRIIRCLQDNKMQGNFGQGCRDELHYFEELSARDYRLNYRLFKACKDDTANICAEACAIQEGELCGGKVLACLSERHEDIRSSSCRKEVSYLQALGVQDFRTDMQLAEACRPDVAALCSHVEAGEGRVHQCLRENFDQLSPECRREELRTESKEADNIQMNPSLLHTCSGERSLFCSGVQPGSARVFRCLAHNLASADFGAACRSAVLAKLKRREANWRLDPPLRKACKADVENYCGAQDAAMTQDGQVKQCLIAQADSISTECRRELGHSLYMAFFVWQPQGLLTAPCDEDIHRFCLSRVKEVTPGAVTTCLSEIVEFMTSTQTSHRRRALQAGLLDSPQEAAGRKVQPRQRGADAELPSSNSTARYMLRLSEQCYQLAALAQLPQAGRSSDFTSAAYELLHSSLGSVGSVTGLKTLQHDPRTGGVAVSLTGWAALAGMASLVVLLLTVATWAMRQYVGGPNAGYSLVGKEGTVVVRLSQPR